MLKILCSCRSEKHLLVLRATCFLRVLYPLLTQEQVYLLTLPLEEFPLICVCLLWSLTDGDSRHSIYGNIIKPRDSLLGGPTQTFFQTKTLKKKGRARNKNTGESIWCLSCRKCWLIYKLCLQKATLKESVMHYWEMSHLGLIQKKLPLRNKCFPLMEISSELEMWHSVLSYCNWEITLMFLDIPADICRWFIQSP